VRAFSIEDDSMQIGIEASLQELDGALRQTILFPILFGANLGCRRAAALRMLFRPFIKRGDCQRSFVCAIEGQFSRLGQASDARPIMRSRWHWRLYDRRFAPWDRSTGMFSRSGART
jgi:hypothetical protein